MLKINWVEIFLRLIPEMLLIVWGIHIIAKKSFDIKKYIFLSFILSIITFLIRDLPIYFGVHTLIMAILIIGTMVFFIRIPIITSIYGTLFMLLLLSISEFLNMLLLNLFKININISSMNPIKKSIFGIPSLIFLFFLIMLTRYLLKKRGIKNVPD
ncbi:MAG TPA: hypothetical protein DC034_00420 [Clostridium sp.]|jgi:hypothetical protein|uniref:Uncharacterized protein n=1 Tax=Clostridium lapidicellarium TaxID=3240931 RepID=A0ABV4DZB7_9CLOT|nr:hypothetical protein [Clostridium sp.]